MPSIYFCFGIVALALLCACIYSFRLGVEALWNSRSRTGTLQQTMFFLAINLCEPLMTPLIIYALSRLNGFPQLDVASVILLTAPMIILLAPVFGLRVSDPFHHSINAQLFAIGLMRWLLNIAILLLIEMEWAGLSMLLMLIACLLLLFSIYSGKHTLDDLLSMSHLPPVTPRPIPAPPRLSIPAAPVFVPPAPPAPSRAIRCALCHAPTDRDDTECHACGLVFASRVPAALRARRDYIALRPLGAGGMSSVYLAQDAAGALCVLKTLLSVDEQSATWRAEAAACLRHEAALLHQIDHPRIARLRDQVSDARGTFLVLEYVAGETLEAQLTRPGAHGTVLCGAALPPRIVVAYGASIASTLCYLADLPQPVVHCDIKPANLIVPPGSTMPVLVDFGRPLALWVGGVI